jgi:hypothetical protein
MANGQNDVTNAYHPQDHLILLKTVTGPKHYYPFCWRLHEFRLRYPMGILDAEILHVDVERDLVVVKVTAKADELGSCIGVGLQAGGLTTLTHVTERAQAQALADLGIGCPWPVAFDDMLEGMEVLQSEPAPIPLHEGAHTASSEDPTPSESKHQPVRTAETVQAFYARTYGVKSTELEAKWAKFCLGITGRALAQGPLTGDELNKINGIISRYWEKQHVQQASTGSIRKAP